MAEEHPTHLRQIDTGRIYVWTKILAGRADMEPYEFPTVVPEEELDKLMEDAEDAGVPAESPVVEEDIEDQAPPVIEEDTGSDMEFAVEDRKIDSERMAAIKEAISKILPEEYTKAIGKLKPAMPKVKQVSELAGFPVSGAEIAAAME